MIMVSEGTAQAKCSALLSVALLKSPSEKECRWLVRSSPCCFLTCWRLLFQLRQYLRPIRWLEVMAESSGVLPALLKELGFALVSQTVPRVEDFFDEHFDFVVHEVGVLLEDQVQQRVALRVSRAVVVA
jgi:hypothetical protein